MNIVFGGTFNPPTYAHYLIAKKIIADFEVENFIFLPTGLTYNKKDLELSKARIDMLNILKSKLGNKVIISDLEFKDNKYKGTKNSLDILNKKYYDIYFLLGADNFISLDTWINFDSLILDYKFIVIKRNNIDVEKFKERYNINAIIINSNLDISSTEFRKNKTKDLLLPEVALYIEKNKLY